MSAALILSTALSVAGAAASAYSKKKAQEKYENYLTNEYYKDPLNTIGNRSMFKTMDEREKDELDALNNRAVAGGATMENQLAARKAHNQVRSEFDSRLLQNYDARRQAVQGQLEGSIYNSNLQNAQNWQAWGAAASNAAMQWGNAKLLENNNSSFNADDWAADKEKVFV